MMASLPKPYVPVTQVLLAVMKIAAEHHRAGRHATARAMYQEVLELDPRHGDALFLLGVLERQQGRLEQAQQRLIEAARWSADRGPVDAELRLVENLLHRRRRKQAQGWSANYCHSDCSGLTIAARA